MPENKKDIKKWTYYIKHFWFYVKPYKAPLRIVYILWFLNSAINLIPAYSIRYYIDIVLLNKDAALFGHTFKGLPLDTTASEKVLISIIYILLMIFLLIGVNSIGVAMWRLGTRNSEKVLFDIKTQVHNHINKLSLGYFNSERVGVIMTKAIGDVDNLSMLLQHSFFLTYHIIQFTVTPLLLLTLSPIMALVVLIPLPLIFFSFYNIKHKLKPLYKEQRENVSYLNSHIQESVTGIREVKAFNMEEQTQEAYRSISWKYYDMQQRIMRVFSFNHQLQYGSKDLGKILCVAIGGILAIKGIGGVSVGIIMSFVVLAGHFFDPISTFLNFYDIFQRGMVSLERIIDFLNVEQDVKDEKDAVDLNPHDVKGEVSFKNIYFAYNPEAPVLQNISFNVKPGEKIAVVGPSGSGKSTLISLLLRFYNPASGTILIDGEDIKKYTQTSIRSSMGIVFQETFLFFGTIRDNFLFVDPNKSDTDVINACIGANIYKDIMELPEKFDTMVGERGVKLSGGQKQRIAIARVLLKNPRIVILDEATSSVDTVTESLIQNSIEKMLIGRTSFIIAHRLSTIKNCDKIIVLNNKTISEAGTHEELMNLKGMYYSFHQKNLSL